MSEWQPIETAPYNTPVRIKAGRYRLDAILVPGGAVNSEEQTCDQWQATTDHYPKCWSDGACWEVNADEQASVQPTHWQPLTASPALTDPRP